MNKGVLIGGVVLVVALAWLMFLRPDPTPRAPTVTPKTPTAAPVAPDTSPPPVRPAPKTPVANVDAGAAAADAGLTVPDAEAKPKGPFTVDLGEHRIHLRERDGRVVEIHAKLKTNEHVVWREILGRKRSLIRMMFFLGTHRAADGAANDVGGASFKATLEERFGNVIRTGDFELVFERFEVFKLPPKAADAGP